MADLVNLRRARKARDRAARESDAAANRVLHGTSRTTRDADSAGRALADKRLDGHRLDERAAGGDE